jgi:HKD family nuclease
MTATFILQGLTPQNHISAFADLMKVDDIQRILVGVAFVNSGGVGLLADHVRPHAAKTTVYAGIRNGITSAQAMKALLDLGVDLRAVDTGSPHLVFHPKLYYVRGKRTARLLVGSANLTTGGLNNNIEASVGLELDLSSPEDSKLAKSFEQQLDDLAVRHPSNVSSVPKKTSLEQLLADQRLADERNAPPRIVSRLSGGAGTLNPIPLIKLLTTKILSRVAKQKSVTKPPPALKVPAPKEAPVSPLSPLYELMWTTTGLTERDLNAPKGKTTNATGSINLDKGAMEKGVPFQTYFHDEVFNHLSWDPADEKGIKRTQAHFRLVVEGVDCGDFPLMVQYDTRKGTKTQLQGNAMTALRWGPAKPYVARPELVGRTLQLFRAADDPTRFLIDID